MCKPGTTRPVMVNIPAELSWSGKSRWETKPVDSCIAPIVDALVKGQVLTAGSCCGHGKGPGEIRLQDGRILMIADPNPPEPAESCSSCQFAVPAVADDGPTLLCKRYPPQPFSDGEEAVQAWPQMVENDWCGEYERKCA